MLVASFNNVTTHYGAQVVLQGLSFKISSGQKLGLIGPNGSGKTTVLRALLGEETPTGGSVFLAPGIRVGYVPQYVEREEDETAIDWLLAEQRVLANELRKQESRLSRSSGADTKKAMRAYQNARDNYDRIDGDTWLRRAQAMLDALGLGHKAGQRVDSLSGGEKNVLSLVHALLAEPELLVVDEPANHLDYMGVAWLEDFLRRFKGAVLMVSHNRYLLDHVVSGILTLHAGRVRYYDGGYSTYRATSLREMIAQQSNYIVNQKRLAQLEALVERLANVARGKADPKAGRQLRARRSQLARERKQAVEKPVLSKLAIRADFKTEATHANVALQVRGYDKSFDDLKLFEGADIDIAGSERVALVGPNGSGKTTLLRDLIENGEWDNSVIRVGPSLRVGYASQEQEVLDGDRTILDEMRATVPMSTDEAFGLLRKFLFERDDLHKRTAELSGGERNRLQLARLMALKPNFLVLDEPTNHLDIATREAVEEALDDFDGTLLIVSHDRYFLDRVVNRVVEVRDRKLTSYPGNFTEFWRAREQGGRRPSGRIADRRNLRKSRRAGRAAERSAGAATEQRIKDLEEEKLDLERQIGDAFNRNDRRAARRAERQLDRTKTLLDELYSKWIA